MYTRVNNSLIFCFYLFVLILGSLSAAEDKVRVASVQYAIEGDQSKEAIVKKIEAYVKTAVKQKAQIVLFPEWVALDVWPLKEEVDSKKLLDSLADEFTPYYWKELKRVSNEQNIVIAGGSTAYRAGGRIFNTAVVVFPDGRLVMQNKNYRTAWEKKNNISLGDKQIKVVDAGFAKIAVMICYDAEFPDLSASLAREEVDLLLVPSMTESQEGVFRVRWSAQARAVEHTSYVVISPTQGRPLKSWEHFGRAVFLSPQLPGFPGVIREADSKRDGVWVSELDIEELRRAKQESSWRPAKDMRQP